MLKWTATIFAFLVALALILLAFGSISGCATVRHSETLAAVDGSSRTTIYRAIKFNLFGKTDSASESFSSSHNPDGASTVEAGQAIESQDNTGSQAVVLQMLELLLPYIVPVPPLDDVLTMPE